MKSKAHRGSHFERVYFIGAGFSAGMYYPTGRTLMWDLVEYLRGESQHDDGYFTNSIHETEPGPVHAAAVVRVIERVLKTYFATKLSAIDRVDVAEFFTLAQALSERSWLAQEPTPRRGPRIIDQPSESTLFSDLAAVTRSYFTDLSRAYQYPDDIEAVLGLVRPNQDAVINFNWDEEVDIFFSIDADADVAYTLGSWRPDGETLVLKPHGSIGWYDLRRGIGNEDAYLIAAGDSRIARYHQSIIAYTNSDLPLDVDGVTYHSALACPPVITSPTFAKRFEYVEQQRIWQDVLEVCANATDFIFLGYSLPKDDFLTRAAIRAAMARNRTARRLRCLVVDRSFEDAKFLNLLSVFPGLSRDRNFLSWEFGSDDESLAFEVKRKLSRAVLAGA